MLTLLLAAVTAFVPPDGPDPFDIKVRPSAPGGEVVRVMEGSSLTFWVEVQSRPPPTYSWFLPNDSAPSFTERTFPIHTVSREHEGTYSCWANNSATQRSRLAVLRVQVLGESLFCSSPWFLRESQPPRVRGGPRAVEASPWLVAEQGPDHGKGPGSRLGAPSTRPCRSLWGVVIRLSGSQG